MINCQWSDEELAEHLNAEAKQYIAKNNIQLYTINAIDKAIEIGMGKRTNTILQSAFFKLANVMPIDQAVEFMKAAAKKSYSKKGDAVVEMNYKAIDALSLIHILSGIRSLDMGRRLVIRIRLPRFRRFLCSTYGRWCGSSDRCHHPWTCLLYTSRCV